MQAALALHPGMLLLRRRGAACIRPIRAWTHPFGRHEPRHGESRVRGFRARACSAGPHQGCCMMSGMVMRFRGSTTNMRLRRSVTSWDRASRLSRMKGDSLQDLFTSCNLRGTPASLNRLAIGGQVERSMFPFTGLSEAEDRLRRKTAVPVPSSGTGSAAHVLS